MPRRKEKGRQSPQVARLQFDPPADLFRVRLGASADVTGGSRELRRRILRDQQKRHAA